MISQSSAHERRVEKLIQNFQEKPFSEEPILKIHNHVKNVLFDRVTKEKDPKEIVELIANAEEIIGMTYQKIAVELRNKAKQYEDMAKALETLEQEEYIHRDIVLGKKKIQEMK
jgi:rubrerythrin